MFVYMYVCIYARMHASLYASMYACMQFSRHITTHAHLLNAKYILRYKFYRILVIYNLSKIIYLSFST